MKILKYIIFSVLISGCASITHDKKQRIIVSTPGAPKAECHLSSQSLGKLYFTTPEAIELTRTGEMVEVTCHKQCFYDETKKFIPVINTEDLASNGFIGGAAPLAIDLTTKKYYNYEYDFVIQMNPDRRCPRKRKGYLDGDLNDFDNTIEDFTFDDPIKNSKRLLPSNMPRISPVSGSGTNK